MIVTLDVVGVDASSKSEERTSSGKDEHKMTREKTHVVRRVLDWRCLCVIISSDEFRADEVLSHGGLAFVALCARGGPADQ